MVNLRKTKPSTKIERETKTQNIGTNGFRKREVVITTEEQYPQDILVEFIQDKCDLLNRYSIGQDVKIHCTPWSLICNIIKKMRELTKIAEMISS